MTSGEIAFIEFCNMHNYSYERIKETDIKTPDFILYYSNMSMLVEIKDYEINAEELSALEYYKQHKWATWNTTCNIGNRVRNKIDDASKQLRNYKDLKLPFIILLYDNRIGATKIISEYEINVGMYGLESRILNHNSIEIKHGPHRKMTSKEKRYISYLGILEEDSTIVLYENYYADIKIDDKDLNLLAGIRIKRKANDPGNTFSGFIDR